MKKNLFFYKATFILIGAMLFTGGHTEAQSDPGADQELNEALKNLEVVIMYFDDAIRYIAPSEDPTIEAMYALEKLEQFVAEAEKVTIYKAPAYTDEFIDYPLPGKNQAPPDYITQIPVFHIWFKFF
jgi:hypothetical protein